MLSSMSPAMIPELRSTLQEEWTEVPQQLINNIVSTMDRRCRSFSPYPLTISPTKDWIFIASHLLHGRFCLLFSCSRNYLVNKIPFLSFGLIFWKFYSHNHVIILRYDLCRSGARLHVVTCKKKKISRP